MLNAFPFEPLGSVWKLPEVHFVIRPNLCERNLSRCAFVLYSAFAFPSDNESRSLITNKICGFARLAHCVKDDFERRSDRDSDQRGLRLTGRPNRRENAKLLPVRN